MPQPHKGLRVRMVTRVPPGTHAQAVAQARKDNLTVSEWLSKVVAEKVGQR